MVMEAVTRHEELFRSLAAKHADLYSPKLAELVMGRAAQADANYNVRISTPSTSETCVRNIELVGEAESARKHAEELREDYERKIARLAAEYEQARPPAGAADCTRRSIACRAARALPRPLRCSRPRRAVNQTNDDSCPTRTRSAAPATVNPPA